MNENEYIYKSGRARLLLIANSTQLLQFIELVCINNFHDIQRTTWRGRWKYGMLNSDGAGEGLELRLNINFSSSSSVTDAPGKTSWTGVANVKLKQNRQHLKLVRAMKAKWGVSATMRSAKHAIHIFKTNARYKHSLSYLHTNWNCKFANDYMRWCWKWRARQWKFRRCLLSDFGQR